MAHECFHCLWKKKKKRSERWYGSYLDMSKAYVHQVWSGNFWRVRWRRWISRGVFFYLIIKCVKSPFFSILVNGQLTWIFKSSCGLRQAYPLSYLFSYGVRRRKRVRLFMGYNLAKKLVSSRNCCLLMIVYFLRELLRKRWIMSLMFLPSMRRLPVRNWIWKNLKYLSAETSILKRKICSWRDWTLRLWRIMTII